MTRMARLRLIQASTLNPTTLVVRSTSPSLRQEGSVRHNQARLLSPQDSNQCTPVLGLHDLLLLQCPGSCNSISHIHPNLMHHYHHYINTIHSLGRLHHLHLVLYHHWQGHTNHNMPRHRRRPHTRPMCPSNRAGFKSMVLLVAGDLFLNNPDQWDLHL